MLSLLMHWVSSFLLFHTRSLYNKSCIHFLKDRITIIFKLLSFKLVSEPPSQGALLLHSSRQPSLLQLILFQCPVTTYTIGRCSMPSSTVNHLSSSSLEHLRAFMNPFNKTSSSCSLTMAGKSSSFLSFNASGTENIWIIDSGVTDHMTPHSSYFSSYTFLTGNQHNNIEPLHHPSNSSGISNTVAIGTFVKPDIPS